MSENAIYDILAQLEKAIHEMETLSADDEATTWGRNLETQADLYWQLYNVRGERKHLEQSIAAFEIAATYYQDAAQVHFAAIQCRLQDIYVDMARLQQATTYMYKARDAGLQAQKFYVHTHNETRDIHFELLARQTQIMTALALLEGYAPYGDEALHIAKKIIKETHHDADLLGFHIEGHRVLGKAYVGIAKMMNMVEQREALLEATRILGKLRRFTHQSQGNESMLRGLLLMGFTYIELELIENNPDYLPPAVRSFQQALTVNKTVGDSLAAAIAFYTVSMLYERMNKAQQAAEAAQHAADCYQRSGMLWMAQIAALRARYFAQATLVRMLLSPLLMMLTVPVNLHRRNILPRVLK
ncbi:MAG: hypothetical protein Q9P01_15210 [Anaerolineae bacterium]|nr:hypothetical protein [Anaerolineae bacterium]MDQ7036126.1 hypothetical protein [Anaerolineae bacterium]